MNEVTTPKVSGNNGLLILLALVVVAILAVGGYLFYKNGMPGGESAVAMVDGQPITESDYNRSTAQISNVYTAQGLDTTSGQTATDIRDQALNTLINRQLILNAAAEAGTTVSNETVEAEYQSILTNMGGEQGLSSAIAASGVTLDQFREDLETDLVINAYLEQKLDTGSIVITDEEVQAAYDAAAASGAEGLPPFEEVSELIREQLVNDKQQAAIAAELERLRGEATIEILI